MTFYDSAELSEDPDFRKRIIACAGEQGNPSPEQWGYSNRWTMIGPGFADAYAYAVLAGVPNPGRDEAVISDSQIRSQYQYLVPPPEGEPVEQPTDAWVRPRILDWLAAKGIIVSDNVWTQALSNAELLDLVRGWINAAPEETSDDWGRSRILDWLRAHGADISSPNLSNAELLDLVRDVQDVP